jgi:hypothetical protein
MLNWIRNAIVSWLTHATPLPATPLSDFQRIRCELRPGDVLLLEGRSRVSEVIKMITQSSWSHAALYIGQLKDIEDPQLRQEVMRHVYHPVQPMETQRVTPFAECSGYTEQGGGVINSASLPQPQRSQREPPTSSHTTTFSGSASGEPDSTAQQHWIVESELGLGTVVRTLDVYEGEHMRICRPKGLRAVDQQRVMAYAIERLGTAYDVRQIFDLARFLFPWFIMPRRWRSTLFSRQPGGNTYTVCSTMIAEAFHSVQFPILPLVKRVVGGQVRLFRRNPKLCVPSDFDYSPYFDIIKYPFLDMHDYGQRQLQPWEGTVVLTDEERELYLTAGVELPAMYDDVQ